METAGRQGWCRSWQVKRWGTTVTGSKQATKQSGPLAANIFLVYSPLHYLAAESITVHFGQNARNLLFFLKPEFKELVDLSKWDAADFLPWPRFYPQKGLFGRIRRTRKNLAVVGSTCAGVSEIRLHTPVIDTEAVNYFINFLRTSYPTAEFSVRLIPDGLLNVQRHPLGRLKEIFQYCKKARRLICPALDYYTFKGDRTGSDAEVVDRIYVLQGFPHEYDRAKTVEISLLKEAPACDRAADERSTKRRALVLGQPLIAFNRFTEEDMLSVALGIRAFIDDCGISEIEYKSHPRDSNREFGHQDYKELVIVNPLETYLASNHYDLIIGVCSTALLTARMILPESCRIVAYGMDMIKYRGERDKKNVESPFLSLGVEVVEHRRHRSASCVESISRPIN